MQRVRLKKVRALPRKFVPSLRNSEKQTLPPRDVPGMRLDVPDVGATTFG